MACVFISLKLRLLCNVVGRKPARLVGLAVYLCATAGLGLLVAAALGQAHWTDQQTTVAAPFTSALISVGWIVMPIAFTGVDATLDPSRLAPFPLTARQAVPGLTAAAMIGGAPLMTLAILVGVAAHGGGVLGVALGLLAAVGQVVLCVVSSRALTTGLAGLLRSRRTRDLSFTIMAILAGAGGLAGQLSSELIDMFTWSRMESWVAVLRWTPLALSGGVTANAATGDHLYALAHLGMLGGTIVAVGALWWRLLDRSLRSPYDGAIDEGDTSAGTLAPRRLARLLPDSALGAVTAKELRYLWRHPRARADVLTSTIFFFVLFVPLSNVVTSGDGRAVLLASGAGAMLGLAALNMLAIDGRGSWFDALAGDYRTVLSGKALARALLSVPIVFIAALGLAVVNGGWRHVLVAPFIGAGLLGVHLGVGVCASVFSPVTLPDGSDTNPWNASGGTNFAAGMLSLAFFALGSVVAAPLITVVMLVVLVRPEWIVLVTPFALCYGAVAWSIGSAIAVDRAERCRPELMATLGY